MPERDHRKVAVVGDAPCEGSVRLAGGPLAVVVTGAAVESGLVARLVAGEPAPPTTQR
ncbi:MAG: hypothetical protein M3349_00215 [Actinomycetota bacterium]|nr:hypothetical protein [Actinomycetota bacterium]